MVGKLPDFVEIVGIAAERKPDTELEAGTHKAKGRPVVVEV